jgi:hypothetical protein
MASPKPRIFIGVPTADGIIQAECAASLIRMVARLNRNGIVTEFRTNNGTSIVAQKNLLAEEFMAGTCTHCLFVDSDMIFADDLCETLLGYGRRLIGAVYTKRTLDLARLKILAATKPFDQALALAYDWNMHPLPGRRVTVENGICRVSALPGGFVLTERACFEELAARSDLPLLELAGSRRPVRAFFRELRQGLRVFDLDYSFCMRWSAAGGEVWAYPGAQIRHIGDHRADLPFTDFLATLRGTTHPAAPEEGAGRDREQATR